MDKFVELKAGVPMAVVSVDGPIRLPRRARRYIAAGRITYWVAGPIGTRRDALNILIMSDAIKSGYRALDCTIVQKG